MCDMSFFFFEEELLTRFFPTFLSDKEAIIVFIIDSFLILFNTAMTKIGYSFTGKGFGLGSSPPHYKAWKKRRSSASRRRK